MIVQGRKLWVAQYDLSGDIQGVALTQEPEMQDDTVMSDTTRSNTIGLDSFTLQHEGLWSAGAGNPDAIIEAHRDLDDVLGTVTPVDGAEGAIAYFCLTTQGAYSFGGSVGDLHRYSVSLAARDGAVRGTLMHNASRTATANGTARQLGAVGASEKLYAGIHVVTVSGTNPTLDVIVESDSQEDFLGTPATQITFAQKTAVGSEWATPVSGAIADTWWRIGWTIGGTATPTFEFIVAVGIK